MWGVQRSVAGVEGCGPEHYFEAWGRAGRGYTAFCVFRNQVAAAAHAYVFTRY